MSFIDNEIAMQGNKEGVADEVWQTFVLTHGIGSRVRDLAAVTGADPAAIERLKGRDHSGGERRRRKDFGALFELWHGRQPRDDEWPKPNFLPGRGSYEWLLPEIGILAGLVGTMGPDEISSVLTTRLRQVTGDPEAQRDRQAVQNVIARIGLQSSDVLGGITVPEAGRRVGSLSTINQALRSGRLTGKKVGKHIVISHESWKVYEESIQGAPPGYVSLASLKKPLGVASDKLSEFARMGYVPTAKRVNTVGVHGVRSTQFGTWYVSPEVADKLIEDRHAGLPMPWHGKPLMDNLRVTWRLYQERRHPVTCTTCRQIWGDKGAPTEFDDYVARYPDLAHGIKRHLTMKWSEGLKVTEVAEQSGRTVQHVRRALSNGALVAEVREGVSYITQTDCTRWIARHCPTGDGEKSWVSIETAIKQFGFTREEIKGFIERDEVQSKIGTAGAMRGVLYLARHGCSRLREKAGFTEEQAAARAKVSVEAFRELLKGVNWRGAEGIPLSTVQAVIKRIQSKHGHTVEDAAALLKVEVEWVNQRVQDGTIALKRNAWDDRAYLSGTMMTRLQAAVGREMDEPLTSDWVRLSRAANIGGVSTTTLASWGEEGLISRQQASGGWHYQEDDVRAHARIYWRTCRYKRDKRPEWLKEEAASEQAGSACNSPAQSSNAASRLRTANQTGH